MLTWSKCIICIYRNVMMKPLLCTI
jgi:hypothetical protein